MLMINETYVVYGKDTACNAECSVYVVAPSLEVAMRLIHRRYPAFVRTDYSCINGCDTPHIVAVQHAMN